MRNKQKVKKKLDSKNQFLKQLRRNLKSPPIKCMTQVFKCRKNNNKEKELSSKVDLKYMKKDKNDYDVIMKPRRFCLESFKLRRKQNNPQPGIGSFCCKENIEEKIKSSKMITASALVKIENRPSKPVVHVDVDNKDTSGDISSDSRSCSSGGRVPVASSSEGNLLTQTNNTNFNFTYNLLSESQQLLYDSLKFDSNADFNIDKIREKLRNMYLQ